MNVALGTLISSLDNLVKNKNAADKKTSVSANTTDVETPIFSASIQARYQVLQSKLSKLQNDLSREQARLGILEKENIQPEEISTILFGSNPLFSESIDEVIQEKTLLVEKINAQKRIITEQIRSVEIQSENIHSIGLGGKGDNPEHTLDTIKKSPLPVTNISQKSVERLIKD